MKTGWAGLALLPLLIVLVDAWDDSPIHSLVFPEPVHGLSYDFYETSCPQVHEIVGNRVRSYVGRDPGEAAGILRILFHDCFVQGCDASVLLQTPVTEQTATPNINTLRVSSFLILQEIKADLEAVCPGAVSCADIISLATVKGIAQVGGPFIPIALGRRDRPFAASNETVTSNIPAPTFNFPQLLFNFTSKGLNLTDLIALSGAHTIGRAHCTSVDSQITPTVSTELFRPYGLILQSICLPRAPKLLNVLQMDIETPNHFDNVYFRHVLMGKVPFHSDAALLQDGQARELVNLYAENEALFFRQFAASLFKLSQVGVLTGSEGEIRRKCKSPNHT